MVRGRTDSGQRKLGAGVYGGRLRAQKFAKRLFKKTKPRSEWEGRLHLEEAGRSQYWELRENCLGDSGSPPKEDMIGFLIVCTYIFMIQFVIV